MTARVFAQAVGVVLLLLGVGGLLLRDGLLIGLLNIDVGEDIVHILTGGILAYVGFGQRDENVARSVVGVLGAVYLLVGLLGFVLPFLFGLIPTGYTVADNLVHLALGALGIAVGFVSGGTAPRRGGGRSRARPSCRRSRLKNGTGKGQDLERSVRNAARLGNFVGACFLRPLVGACTPQ